MIPETIGRYTVRRELGHGAMGIVYEAEDPNIGRTVALKVVRTDQIGANRDEVVRRFKNEARAAGNLNHPNIITIYDAGEHEGLLFIAMECVPGATLAEMMGKQGRLPAARVADIIRQVCLGLDFAHQRGIIHRDIKPANILLSDSLVKITDFGIANVGDGMTITGTVVGTPNYMSPEQVLGKPLDGRSDLFSVGVMLYEMVTGERPFEGQSITTIMYKIVHEEPIAPRKLDASIHPGLSAIVEKALAKSPETRFQTGAELAAALEQYKNGATSVAARLDPDAPTAELPALPATASLTGIPAAATATQPIAYPTVVQPPTTQQIPPPVAKKRSFWSTMLLGCFGLIALGIIATTIITIVATRNFKNGKVPAVQINTGDDSNQAKDSSSQGGAASAKVTEISPPKASKTKAKLKLDSTPPSAEVLLDGERTGKSTPATISIPRGEHEISVRMPGFQTVSAKFKVQGGEEFEFSPELTPLMPAGMPKISIPGVPTIDLSGLAQLEQLKKSGGLSGEQKSEIKAWQKWGAEQRSGRLSIIVTSNPEGAEISIDGKKTGKKTPAVLPSAEGTYQITLTLEGHNSYDTSVTVANGRPAIVTAQMAPTPPAPPQ